MMNRFSLAALAALAINSAFAAPLDNAERSVAVGWTHAEYLEYLALNTTEGWSGMAHVKYVNATEMASTGLAKRSGDNLFEGYSDHNCGGNVVMSWNNFACGVCVTSNTPSLSGYLYRQGNGNPYPTADWYTGSSCHGVKNHHQGITSSNHNSCDDINTYGVQQFYSAMLYQGC